MLLWRTNFNFCNSCQVAICKYHKILHEKRSQREHIFQKLGKKLTTKQLAKVIENLSSKIQAVNGFEYQIIRESRRLLVIIQILPLKP